MPPTSTRSAPPSGAHTAPGTVRRLLRSFAVLVVLLLGGATMAVAPASAAVALTDPSSANASSCVSGSAAANLLLFNTPFTMSPPTATATGDLMILTTRTYNESSFLGSSTYPDGQGVKWTALQSSGSTHTYYRFRLAGDPAQYQLFNVSAVVTASANIVASITSYAGADSTTPFANAGAISTGSGTGSVALPNAGITRGGSLRYSSITTDKVSTYNYAGASPLAEDCNIEPAASLTVSSEPMLGPTTTPSHSVTIGGGASPAWVAVTYVIQPPLSSCASGGTSLTTPATVTFPTTTLNGLNRTVTTTAPVTINDQTGLMAGWSLSGTSTTFTSGANTLPASAMTITGVTAAAAAGNCVMPTNTVGWPLTLPAGVVAPTASKLYNALITTGMGPVNLTLAASLALPANTRVGTYSSTWTLTIATGP